MKKLIIFFIALLFTACAIPKEYIGGETDKPKWLIVVYGNGYETFPNPPSAEQWLLEYHKGNTKKIKYFSNDSVMMSYMDSTYIDLDEEKLQ